MRGVAQRLRAAQVPSSVIWTEDWRGGNDEGTGYVLEEDWELDRDLYPDFESVADELHAAGFKWLTYNNSFVPGGNWLQPITILTGRMVKFSAEFTF